MRPVGLMLIICPGRRDRGERRIDPIDLRDFADPYEKPLDFFYPARRGSRKRSSG